MERKLSLTKWTRYVSSNSPIGAHNLGTKEDVGDDAHNCLTRNDLCTVTEFFLVANSLNLSQDPHQGLVEFQRLRQL
jgi:hypothetical protein